MVSIQLEDDLWHFACAFYAKPGRATKLLWAQQHHGLWINHYLTQAFALHQGLRLSPASPRLLRHQQWLVKPCRYWRQSCQGEPQSYAIAKALELELERRELVLWSKRLRPGAQHDLSAFFSGWPSLWLTPTGQEARAWLHGR